MARVKAIFFLPVKDNEGRDLSQEIAEARSEVFRRFGGWTFQGNVIGAYRMSDGSEAIDVSEACMLVLDEERLEELQEILRAFKKQARQEAIYLELQWGVEIRLV
jgi:hypothetical protein